MQSPLDPWPVPASAGRAPAVAAALWLAFVALAGAQGVFARLEPEAYAALVAFIVAFTALTAFVDADVRPMLDRVSRKLWLAGGMDAALATAWAVHASQPAWSRTTTGALALLVLLPLAVALHAAGARGARLRRAPGASPGAKRAAT